MKRVFFFLSCVVVCGALFAQVADQSEPVALTLEGILQQLREGTPPESLQDQLKASGLKFQLSMDDIMELREAGASNELILSMVGVTEPAISEESTPVQTEPPYPSGLLTLKQVSRMHDAGIHQATIIELVTQYGLTEPPALGDLSRMLSRGASEDLVRAMAVGATTEGIATRRHPLPPTLDTEFEAVAGDKILERAAKHGQIYGQPDHLVPSGDGEDQLWIASVPSGADVFVSPRGTYKNEAFNLAHSVGTTPLSIALEPGDYDVIVKKQAGTFEDSLLPAWRTAHDTQLTRTLLDNAHLVFDPDDCCLPDSLTGDVGISPIDRDQPRTIIGDQFGGLPPFLFDGETTQLMEVKESHIRNVMKTYSVRKNPGQSRVLVSTFIPSSGDPLDQASVQGLPPGQPYDGLLDVPGLGYLRSEEQIAICARALGIETGRMKQAVEMLRRAGKAIIYIEVDDGVRLISMALDYGRLRLLDRTFKPMDSVPASPQPTKKQKRKKSSAMAEPTPLPEVARVVVPGLGLPRLRVANTAAEGVVLHFSDGQFFFIPAGASQEYVVEPGTFQVRVLGTGPPERGGSLHFAYHARYNLTL